MPILKAIGKNKDEKKGSTKQTLAGMKAVLNYIARAGKEEQIYKAFGIGLSDNVDKANDKIIFNKKTHDKVDSNLYKHYALSFAPGFNNLELIEKITKEFVQKEFLDKGFLAFVGIHIDKDHYHSHILVDTVNFNTGYKLHQLDNADLKKARYKDKILPEQEISLEHLKNSMEEISLNYGVESPERNKEKDKSINIGTMSKYKGVTSENSWRTRIAEAFQEVVLNVTTTTENLQSRLQEKGIYFNRFNKEKKTLTLATQYQDNKGVSKKGLVKLNKLEAEEDYRFKVTKNIYNWENLFEELESHKVKMLEQEKEIIKEDKEFNFMDILQEKILEYDKEVEKDKEIKKEKEKSYSYSYSYEDYTPSKKSNTEKEYIPPVAPVKSVEKKEEEKPKVVELNAIEKAKISQQIAEEQRLKELRAEELAKKKKKKATEWLDEKDQWVDEKDEWVSEWEDDKNDWDLSK
ncbi:relaxase/mobilization nuclease domain-containing protein [Fusobacterium hwasookii]|uniref:Relaxase n=1 Tax=Fusobacterium hwasookii ChDC F128 TaxID=1216362 RepID=A0ABP2R1S1_9FUSO|nr:relaxase/mobilization nuclease domain-containing protein [Fusobacterium hwasookii]EJU06720.1 relaxase [Fusobacterium hwasookii ChDC F128]